MRSEPEPLRIRHAVLNTVEHGVTRVADALITLLVIRWLPVESFSVVALAQAWVAALLLFFVAPETSFYRYYGAWRAEGREALTARVRVFRLFAVGKLQLALVAAWAMAFLLPAELSRLDRFCAAAWAFTLPLVSQVAGPDRELLRVELRLRWLNALTLVQKATLLGGVAVAGTFFRADFLKALACVAGLNLALTLAIARIGARRALRLMPPAPAGTPVPALDAVATLREAIGSFSLWSHLAGVLQSWVQTLDLFVLGLVGAPLREIGLYGAVLKVANFGAALPMAGANFAGIWLARQGDDADSLRAEVGRVRKASGFFALAVLVQAFAIALVGPWILLWLGAGKWSPAELESMVGWLALLLAGGTGLWMTYFPVVWASRRGDVRKVVTHFSVPWAAAAFTAYATAAALRGVDGVAWANVAVGAVALALGLARLLAVSRRLREGGGA